MRANRLLGASLVEQNLVKIGDLESANEHLLEVVSGEHPRKSTVLGILAYQMKVLREEDVLQHVIDEHGLGLVDLRNYDASAEIKKNLDIGTCWATWSVPFDQEDDFHLIATAYYLSPAVRTYWEKKYEGPIIWYGTTLEMIADFLEKLGGGSRSPVPAPPAATAEKKR